VLEGPGRQPCAKNSDIKEFYLGLNEGRHPANPTATSNTTSGASAGCRDLVMEYP